MKTKLLLHQISLAVATLFLIIACFSKDYLFIAIGLGMIIYSSNRIKKLKG